jgi:hypothetical protein
MDRIAQVFSSLRWPSVVAAALFGLYEIGGKAVEWVWIFAYNLRWPALFAMLLVIALSVYIAKEAEERRRRTQFGDPENTDAKWRQMAGLQGSLLMVGLTAILFAIPTPNYSVREVPGPERVVVKNVPGPIQWRDGKEIVYEQPLYLDFYQKCVDTISGNHSDDELALCHKQALEGVAASKPAPQIRVQFKRDPYEELFNNCNDRYGLDGVPSERAAGIRNERIRICHDAAMAASGSQVAATK